jgi:hypothetical protein
MSYISGLVALIVVVAGWSAPQSPKTLVVKYANSDPIKIQKAIGGQGDEWLENLAIEVENTSNKPVYFVRLTVILPQVVENNKQLCFDVIYGDWRLVNLSQKANAGNSAIPPGQRMRLYFSPGNHQHLVNFLSSRSRSLSTVTTASVLLQEVNFGDGTGYLAGRFLFGGSDPLACPCSRYSRDYYQCVLNCDRVGFLSAAATSEYPCHTITYSMASCTDPATGLEHPCDYAYANFCDERVATTFQLVISNW